MKTARSDAKPQTTTARILGNAVRLALIAGIVWFGWSSAQALTVLLSGGQPAAQATAAAPQQQLPLSPVSVPGRGYWSFAGCALGVEIRQVPMSQVLASLSTPPISTTPGNDSVNDSQLLALLARMTSQVECRETMDVYISDQPRLKLRAFVDTSGERKRFLGGYMAYPRGKMTWTILAGTPDPAARATNVPQPSLLPLPVTATRACSRFDLQHRLQCEFVTCPTDSKTLETLWTAKGWTTEPAPWGTADQIVVLCSRGNEMVQVTLLPGSGKDELTLMLLRLSPSPTERGTASWRSH